MRKLLNVGIVFAVAMLLVCQGTAWAGGGGTKANATIRVTNNSVMVLGVIVDPKAGFVIPATPKDFTDQGGKLVQPGAKVDFKVVAGNHRVIAALVDPGPPVAILPEADRQYSVGKGKTLNLVATEKAGNTELTP